MSLPADYLQYPKRSGGPDHARFDNLYRDRPALQLPMGGRLGVWIFVGVEFFPLNPSGKPILTPGGVTAPYPDLRNYTARDYGTRVGVYRLLEVLARLSVSATFGVQGWIAHNHPWLVTEILAGGHEVCAYGWDTDSLHSVACGEAVERDYIDRTLAALAAAGASPSGWISPARMESPRTPDLVKEAGLSWIGDWSHDEGPSDFRTTHGPLVAMPFAQDLDDWTLLMEAKRPDEEWGVQTVDAAHRLLKDAERFGPQLLALSVRPFLMGQPSRVSIFRDSLASIMELEHVETVTAQDLVSGRATE